MTPKYALEESVKTVMPHEGSTRAGILPSCPSLDRGSREAEVGFKPRTFRSVGSRSNHLGHLAEHHLQANHSLISHTFSAKVLIVGGF
ncbi:hypothetical protein T265_08112 [Opisthorchis viverrini]|uniref:Uncharacterized protein n=1 Tax=Opisthorchis viverrini TaxID=6198 RepID=A0A074ZA97_OPIVI|nr:hypothetical protein T265_08112 [Opisthorchis viverrini]KER24176.1 hypothetical protein T265_08112 [Opisthorchis viverrini]